MSNATQALSLPHDAEAELYVLGACLLLESAASEAKTFLKPEDFYQPKHVILFEGITQLTSQGIPVDNITLTKWLRDQRQLERVGGAAYLAGLIRDAISIVNLEHHCRQLSEYANRRRFLKFADGFANTLHNGQMSSSEVKEIWQREMEMLIPDNGGGAVEPMTFKDEIMALQDEGLPKGERTGWRPMDAYYRVPIGLWTVITGIPGMGKTSFVNNLMVNLMVNSGWRFLVYSAENLPYQKYISRLLSLYLGKPFFDGPSQRLSKDEVAHGLDFFQEHLRLIDASNNFTLDQILAEAQKLGRVWPFQGIIIDPWNELHQDRPIHKMETECVGEQLGRFRRFCRTENHHGWIVAHPAKMQRDKETGDYSIPTAYDIAGSANWRNKADFALAVHRDLADSHAPTQVVIQKVRFSEDGQLGGVELRFDKITGLYSDL